MQATQGDWLPARAALHPTGLYFALRDIRTAELQDPFMQETIARVPARESVVQIAREDVGKGGDRHVAGRDRLSRRALRLDARVAAAQAARRARGLRRADAGQRDPAAAAQVAADGGRRRAAFAGRRLCAPRPQALRPEADELEHAVLRRRRRGFPGLAVGPVPARSRRSRRLAPATAGGMDLGRRRARGAVSQAHRPGRGGAVA